MFPQLPLEFLVRGTAVSQQASARSRENWKAAVHAAGRAAVPPGSWALTDRVAITIYYFPQAEMLGDIDNLIKPILDGLNACIYVDDQQVERIVVQKFEPGNLYAFTDPSEALATALQSAGPVIYVRVTDDPHGELT